ncbi:hypothetical protein M3Y94_00495200 [Aphelenchoides besseyi]|nr:hypothetical protein M3Y94_00495200 [Aphelenchoides besseyi]
MARSAQNKGEKQVIDAKVAKVREVVRNVSNNDIVLALHNFDMDVERTIGAFVDGGIENALGSWEKCNNTTKKKKANAGAAENSSAATSTTTETPKVSSVTAPISTGGRSRKPQPQVKETSGIAPTVNPKTAPSVSQSFAKMTDDEKVDELERLMDEVNIKSNNLQTAIDNVAREKLAAFAAITNALKYRERQLDSYLEKTRRELQETITQQHHAYQRVQQKNSTVAVELPRFAADSAALDQLLHQNFALHVDKTIKAIEKLGAGFLPSTTIEIATPPVSNGIPQSNTQLNGDHSAPKQNGKSTAPISNGKPKTAVPVAAKIANGTDIKHSVSQTSLVSSVGEDSGLGQISPVYQEKTATPVADSGLLQSDGLSADQLANLQAIIQQNLESKGLNADLIKGIIGDSDGSAARRRNPRRDGPSNGTANGGKSKSNAKSVKAGQ